jgi:hypothetical protein
MAAFFQNGGQKWGFDNISFLVISISFLVISYFVLYLTYLLSLIMNKVTQVTYPKTESCLLGVKPLNVLKDFTLTQNRKKSRRSKVNNVAGVSISKDIP